MKIWTWILLIVCALLVWQIFNWIRRVGVIEVAAWTFIIITFIMLCVATWKVLTYG